MSNIIIDPAHTKSLATALQQAFVKQENEYIERTLAACSSYCPLKTYEVIRAPSFELLKEKVDRTVDENPELELGEGILNMSDMGYDRYIAVLIQYDFDLKERRQLEKEGK